MWHHNCQWHFSRRRLATDSTKHDEPLWHHHVWAGFLWLGQLQESYGILPHQFSNRCRRGCGGGGSLCGLGFVKRVDDKVWTSKVNVYWILSFMIMSMWWLLACCLPFAKLWTPTVPSPCCMIQQRMVTKNWLCIMIMRRWPWISTSVAHGVVVTWSTTAWQPTRMMANLLRPNWDVDGVFFMQA